MNHRNKNQMLSAVEVLGDGTKTLSMGLQTP